MGGMPEWLLVAGPLLALVGGKFWLWSPWTGPARRQPKGETFAGMFQRCATESRGIAKMWEQYDEDGLAQLHQNLALIYQNYCEIYQQADTPVEAAAVVASADVRRPCRICVGKGVRCRSCHEQEQKATAWPSDALLGEVRELAEFREAFLARQEERIQPKPAAIAPPSEDFGRGLAAFAAQQRQLAAELDSAVHGYQYPTGCRCTTCWAEYQRRSSWEMKPPATKVEMVDVTAFGQHPSRLIPGAPALGTGYDGHCPMCGRRWEKYESKHGVITYWPCMCTE